MRVIKFRAWDKVDKKYLYPERQGFIIVPTEPSFGVTLPYENRRNPDNIDEECFDWVDEDLLVERFELEQYTGLNDKNGKEIYEGDIVKARYDYTNGSSEESVEQVEWSEEEGGFYVGWFYLSGYEDLEVIGNIHENQELLEESK